MSDTRWAPDGSHICVAYADGMALVGSSTGMDPRRNATYLIAYLKTCMGLSSSCTQASSGSSSLWYIKGHMKGTRLHCPAVYAMDIAKARPSCCFRAHPRRTSTAGERLWGRLLGMPLARAEWSPDGQRILFAGAAGGCHVFSAAGDALAQLALPSGQVPRRSSPQSFRLISLWWLQMWLTSACRSLVRRKTYGACAMSPLMPADMAMYKCNASHQISQATMCSTAVGDMMT